MHALFLAHRHRLALDAHHHLVACRVEVEVRHRRTAGARRHERSLVHQVCEIGAREARRPARDRTQVDVGLERNLLRVNLEDLLASLDVGIANHDLPVEAARAQQR